MVVRRLENFESPYLTLLSENKKLASSGQQNGGDKCCHQKCLIVIRKSYWDTATYDHDLLDNKVALNIIYLQALNDVENGHSIASKQIRNQLTSLQAKGDKVQYLTIASTLQYYSCIQFEPCYCDYPSNRTMVLIRIGNHEMNISPLDSEVGFAKALFFY